VPEVHDGSLSNQDPVLDEQQDAMLLFFHNHSDLKLVNEGDLLRYLPIVEHYGFFLELQDHQTELVHDERAKGSHTALNPLVFELNDSKITQQLGPYDRHDGAS
tara:strand:+ start:474 stop:785 length:312 start_codon:yes stop_codon:yes gene_type:complete